MDIHASNSAFFASNHIEVERVPGAIFTGQGALRLDSARILLWLDLGKTW
jgi:hypothetical protein